MIYTHSTQQVSETTSHRITGLISSDDHVLCGDENGDLALRDLYTLHSLTTLPLQLPIQTLALTENKSHILAPLRSVHLFTSILTTFFVSYQKHLALLSDITSNLSGTAK